MNIRRTPADACVRRAGYCPGVTRRPQWYGAGRGELVVVIDCSDLARSARFWTEALGYVDQGGGSATYQTLLPGDGDGIEVLLQRVPDQKRAKSRVHLDLRTRDLDAEVARVVSLGATRLTPAPIEEAGWRWHVLADPDGNELCVIAPPDDYWDEQGGVSTSSTDAVGSTDADGVVSTSSTDAP